MLYCLNTGAVTLTDIIPNQHAGIVGYASYKSNLKIENCGNTGNITCQTKLTTPNAGSGCTAGILGYINNATNGAFKGINNCFNTGTITSYLNNAASLIGQMRGSINLSTELTNYYLKQSGVNPIGYNSNNLNITSVAKTKDQFESGEVTYLLNKKVTDGTQAWYQTIGTDKLPMFSGGIVYYNETASTPYYNFIYTKGDVNNDGNVDKIDVSLVLKHISGSKILNNEKANAADYNGDGKINTLDTIEMLKKIG